MPRRALIPVIDEGRCTGCGWCVPTCHLHLLTLQARDGWKKRSTLHDAQDCTGCSKCAVKCPFGAISMRATTDAATGHD